MSKRSVLVVEDEMLIRMALADALEEADYRVIEAANALQAVAVLGSGAQIDAIVTDVDMPGSMNGLGLLRLAETIGPPKAMIVTSGKLCHESNNMAAGARFFAKPYDIADILTELDRQLGLIGRPAKVVFG